MLKQPLRSLRKSSQTIADSRLKNYQIVLGSSSPRRIQMIKDLGVEFTVIKPDIPEVLRRGESSRDFVRRLSKEKALAVLGVLSKRPKLKSLRLSAVLAADTVVVQTLGGKEKILGKPRDKNHALKMLSSLSGQTHTVLTGFTWLVSNASDPKEFKLIQRVVTTQVRFSARSRSFWKWYISTGEPMDKAGAYAAQGIGMSFIENVKGSYSNVIGLPLPQVLAALEKF